MARSLVLVCALLAACRSRADAHPSSDAGAGKAPVVASSPIADVLEFSTARLGWKSHLGDIHRDDAFANEEATFLGRDLGIAALLRARATVAFANVFEPVNGHRLHLGVVEVAFRRCADLERTMKAVARVHRDTFKVPALSVFRTLRRDRSFIVVFSESSLDPAIKSLLGAPPSGPFVSTGCRDGGVAP
jgi:hypothetical protein